VYEILKFSFPVFVHVTKRRRIKILRGVIGGIFDIQECFVSQKSIFDLFGDY